MDPVFLNSDDGQPGYPECHFELVCCFRYRERLLLMNETSKKQSRNMVDESTHHTPLPTPPHQHPPAHHTPPPPPPFPLLRTPAGEQPSKRKSAALRLKNSPRWSRRRKLASV